MNTTRAVLKLGLSSLSAQDFLSRCISIKSAVAANLGTFATPNPSIVDLEAGILTLTKRQTDVENIGGKDNTFLRNQAKVALHDQMRTLGIYVSGVADGNANIILLSGFDLVGAKGSIGLVAPPNEFIRKSDGKGEGKTSLSWKGVPPANGYMVSIAPVVDGVVGTWSDSIKAKRLNHTFAGLVSGQLYAMRVASLSSEGQGDWSITVTYRPQ